MTLSGREELEWARLVATDLRDLRRPGPVRRALHSRSLTPWLAGAALGVWLFIALAHLAG